MAARKKKTTPKKKKATPRAKAPRAKRGKGKKKTTGGRPAFKYDDYVLEAVGRLAQAGNSQADAALLIGVSLSTFERAIADEKHPISVVWQLGMANVRNGLRVGQLKLAMEGNATMLIWLGKQMLGQRNYENLKISGEGPGGAIPIAGELGEYLDLMSFKLREFKRSRRKVGIELPETSG